MDQIQLNTRKVQMVCKGQEAQPLPKSFIGPLLVWLSFVVVVVFKCNNFCMCVILSESSIVFCPYD